METRKVIKTRGFDHFLKEINKPGRIQNLDFYWLGGKKSEF